MNTTYSIVEHEPTGNRIIARDMNLHEIVEALERIALAGLERPTGQMRLEPVDE